MCADLANAKMQGISCIVCGNIRIKPQIYHLNISLRPTRHACCKALEVSLDDIKDHWCVCLRHFPGGDSRQFPNLHLGKHFVSLVKKSDPRAVRVKRHVNKWELGHLGTLNKDDCC